MNQFLLYISMNEHYRAVCKPATLEHEDEEGEGKKEKEKEREAGGEG